MRDVKRVSTVVALCAALVLLALWLLDDGAERTPVPHTPTATVADESPVPTVPVLDDTREPAPLAPTPLAAPADVPPSSPPLAPLTLAVHHAHGPPAAGAIVAMYARDVDERFLLEAELDADGRWEHPGLDAPVALFVVGASPNPARLDLDVARGTHELVLPEGAWIAGVVLVEGTPPGRPFPIALSGFASDTVLPRGGVDVRSFRLDAPSQYQHGSLRTDSAGRFLVSGLSPQDELRFSGPLGSHVRDDARSTAEPVHAPFDGYVLALVRRPMIRGRVLHTDGSPAAHTLFDLSQEFVRLPPPGNAARPNGMSTWFRDGRTDADGRFEIGVYRHVDLNCYAQVDGRRKRSEGCPPATLRVRLRARHDSGSMAELDRGGFDPYQGAELGDVFLEPAEAWHLRVRDPYGAPITDARVQRVKRDPTTGRLDTDYFSDGVKVDSEGHATIFERDCDARLAVVLAPGHRAVRVDLDEHLGEDPIDVVLSPSSGVMLEIALEEGVGARGWFLEVRGIPPIFSDTSAALPADKLVRLRPHLWRSDSSQLGWPGARMDEEEVVVTFPLRRPTARLDALVPGRLLRLRLYGPLVDGVRTEWEHELRLQPGEQRVIPLDLSESASDR